MTKDPSWSPSPENLRLWQLTDKQLLEAIRGRGNKLATVKALDFACRMFAKAAENDVVLAPGLKAAIGLAQLYGISIAPGHPEHPFRDADKGMTLKSILDRSAQIKVERYTPPEVQHRTRPPIETPTMTVMHNKPLVLRGVDHGTVEGRAPIVQNVPRQYKSAHVAEIALKIEGSFSLKDLAALCPPVYFIQDIQNGITKLLREQKVERVSLGRYGRRRPSQ